MCTLVQDVVFMLWSGSIRCINWLICANMECKNVVYKALLTLVFYIDIIVRFGCVW